MRRKENFAPQAVALEQKRDNKLDFFLLEQQYQRFLLWWEEKSSDLSSTLSFNIENQTNQFIRDLDLEVDFETAFSKIRSDLWGYYLEYIKQKAVLPFTNRIENGGLVGDFYGDKPIVNLIDEREREGAVKKAMVDLERRLETLQPYQVVLRVSPKGWTNMGYDYRESQFQIFYRETEGLVRGLTIRTDIDLDKIVELFKRLGVVFSSSTEKDLLKEITTTNVVFRPWVALDEVIEMIIEISGNLDHQGRDLRKQYQLWKMSDGGYQRYDQLVSLLNFLEFKVKSLLDNNCFSKEALEALLGFVLMAMGEKERREKLGGQEFLESYQYYPDSRYPLIDIHQFDQTLAYLGSLPGCAGGGIFSSFNNNLFQGPEEMFVLTPWGTINVSLNEDERSVLRCVNCPFCHQTVDAEIVKYDEGKIIRCPSCGQEAKME